MQLETNLATASGKLAWTETNLCSGAWQNTAGVLNINPLNTAETPWIQYASYTSTAVHFFSPLSSCQAVLETVQFFGLLTVTETVETDTLRSTPPNPAFLLAVRSLTLRSTPPLYSISIGCQAVTGTNSIQTSSLRKFPCVAVQWQQICGVWPVVIRGRYIHKNWMN